MDFKCVFVTSPSLTDYFAKNLAPDIPWMLCEVPTTDNAQKFQDCVIWSRTSSSVSIIVAVMDDAPTVKALQMLTSAMNTSDSVVCRVIVLAPASTDVARTYDPLFDGEHSACVCSFAVECVGVPQFPITFSDWAPRGMRGKQLVSGADDSRIHRDVFMLFTYQFYERDALFASLMRNGISASLFSAKALRCSILAWCCGMLGLAVTSALFLNVRLYTHTYANMYQKMFAAGVQHKDWGCWFTQEGINETGDYPPTDQNVPTSHLSLIAIGGNTSIVCDGIDNKNIKFIHNSNDTALTLAAPVRCRAVYAYPLLRPFVIIHTSGDKHIYLEGTRRAAQAIVLSEDTYAQLNYDSNADIVCTNTTGMTITWRCRFTGRAPIQFRGTYVTSVTVSRADTTF